MLLLLLLFFLLFHILYPVTDFVCYVFVVRSGAFSSYRTIAVIRWFCFYSCCCFRFCFLQKNQIVQWIFEMKSILCFAILYTCVYNRKRIYLNVTTTVTMTVYSDWNRIENMTFQSVWILRYERSTWIRCFLFFMRLWLHLGNAFATLPQSFFRSKFDLIVDVE